MKGAFARESAAASVSCGFQYRESCSNCSGTAKVKTSNAVSVSPWQASNAKERRLGKAMRRCTGQREEKALQSDPKRDREGDRYRERDPSMSQPLVSSSSRTGVEVLRDGWMGESRKSCEREEKSEPTERSSSLILKQN